MADSAAWFVDGWFLHKEWQGLHRGDRLDYLLLCRHPMPVRPERRQLGLHAAGP